MINPAENSMSWRLGEFEVSVPADWRKVTEAAERLALRSPDDRQRLTFSIFPLDSESEANFRKFCQHRVDAERRELSDGFLQPSKPMVLINGSS